MPTRPRLRRPGALPALACVAAFAFAAAAGGGCKPGGGTPAAAPASAPAAAGPPLFTEITAAVGLTDSPPRWPNGTAFMPEINPGGVAVLDYDGDGRLDLLQTCHPPPGPPDTPAPKRLFRQQPDGTFREVPGAAGLDDTGYGQGVAVGDVDNDGHPDVYFCNFGLDRLYRNNGDGTFADVTAAAGISRVPRWNVAASFFDYDRDNDLDLYVASYVEYDPFVRCEQGGERVYCNPGKYRGVPDTLYRNNGDGTFTDVTAAAGVSAADKGLGVLCADLTGDGWADVFVANDAEPNELWVNRGDGTFVDEAMARGCGVNGMGKPEGNMGVTVGDVNSDGLLDLFVTHERNEKNTLFLAAAPGSYADKSAAAGMAAVDLPYTGWGTGFFDFDHDGDLDVAVVNGRVNPHPPWPGAGATGPYWDRFALPNLLFENDGAGRFTDASARGGGFTKRVEVGRGLAFGDLDGDGDVDLVTSNIDNTLRVYRNNAPKPGTHWLLVRALTGKRDALGAHVTVRAGKLNRHAVVLAGYSSSCSSDPRVHVGLAGGAADAVDVVWPDGGRERFAVPGVDRELVLRQHQGQKLPPG